ncbi:MAG: signal peptide peptidase SppA [Planctomycetes bacterium]|nr:signal peptide peptidase SppA [Planctomycetota bacterium]
MPSFLRFLPVALAITLIGWQTLRAVADEATAEASAEKQTTSDAADSKAAEQETKAKINKVRLAYIKISGELPESPGRMSFFGDLGIDLRKTIVRLDKAAEDKHIAGVVLEIGPTSLTRGKLNELRAAIGRIRAAGKKVHAQMESAMGSQYLLAAACDEIAMPEAGIILIPGVRAEFSYLKDMLDKLGLEADMMHVGTYKGAAEPLTRNSMSEPVRKNQTAMVDDLFDQLVSTIATDRQLKIDAVRGIVDRGLHTVTEAKEAGLVDHVAYPDEVRKQLAEQYEADELVYVVNYGKRKVDTDFSGPMGMIKLFKAVIGSGSKGRGSKGAKIAVVYAVGPIMSGKSQSSVFGGQSMGSETIVKALKKAADDKDVKAIVLRINSPGGSALASDLIWRATQTIDLPIVASMGDVAASGGYYIAMGADRIIAEPGTITGSIGVVGGKIVMGGLYDKIGMSTDVISRGKNSGLFSTTSKFSKAEREVVGNMMQDVYRLFTTKAAEGRNMPLEKLESLAGGQIYSGRDAKRNGLVDELGTLKDAIQAAKQLAGLQPDDDVKLEILPEPENPFESIFGADLESEREAKLLGGLTHLVPELGEPIRRALQWRQVMQEPVTLMMPFWVEIK